MSPSVSCTIPLQKQAPLASSFSGVLHQQGKRVGLSGPGRVSPPIAPSSGPASFRLCPFSGPTHSLLSEPQTLASLTVASSFHRSFRTGSGVHQVTPH